MFAFDVSLMPFSSPFALPVARIFGIDKRSLALFRIVMALVLLSDLATRALDITAFYTDSGILPRSAQIELYSGLPDLFSFHLMSGRVGVQWGLFGLAFLFGLALLVGYHTRWATFLSWLMLTSLHNRNPMVIQGGDVLLRMMLFWAIFLPMGGYWALDAFLRRGVPQETRYESTVPLPDVALAEGNAEIADAESEKTPIAPVPPSITAQPWLSVGTLAILLQLCFMYWFAVALKTGAPWRSEGSALYYALSIDQMVRPLGSALLPHEGLLRFLTFTTVEIERWGPLLALLPFWRLRTFMVSVFLGLHIMMGLCLTLGIFPIVAGAAWLLFLPGQWWDFLARRYGASRANFKQSLETKRLHFRERLDDLFPAVLQDERRARKSAARAKREYLVVQGIASFFLLYIFMWNLRGVDAVTYGRTLPISYNWVGEFLRLDQRWDMFAPFPLKDDGWFVVEAKLNNGKRVDLLRDGAPVSWTKPADLSATYHDALWQKYMLNLWPVSNSGHRGYYAAYLMRQWNDSHQERERIKFMQIVYMEEDTLPNYRTTKPKKVALWRSGSEE